MKVAPPLSGIWLIVFAVFVQSEAEFLDGGDDDLVLVVVGQEATDQRLGIGIFLYAILLKPIELVPGLAVQILAIHDKQTFVNTLVGLEQRGRLEGGKRLA